MNTKLDNSAVLGYLLCEALVRKDTFQADQILEMAPDLSVVRTLDHKINLARSQKFPYRPLELAIHFGMDDLAVKMIEAGAPLDRNELYDDPSFSSLVTDARSSIPLLLAMSSANERVANAIKAKAPPDDFQEQINESLFRAAMGPKMDELKLAIALGADVSAHDPAVRQTPLFHAVAVGSKAAIEVLVDAGASWEFQDSRGRTAKDWLIRNYPDIASELGLSSGVVVGMAPRMVKPR